MEENLKNLAYLKQMEAVKKAEFDEEDEAATKID